MRGAISLILALSGCSVPGWAIVDIASRPPGSFHDQGGMAIAFFYFPVALFGWLLCGLPGAVLGILAARRGPCGGLGRPGNHRRRGGRARAGIRCAAWSV